MDQFTRPRPNESGQKESGQNELGQQKSAFARAIWTHAGQEPDRFFQAFVPHQYDVGFCWRCKVIPGEEHRAIPFDEQPRATQERIATNAEVLLQLFEETPPADLDIMRAAGKTLLQHGGQEITRESVVDGDIPSLREGMSKRHHEKWLVQFRADIRDGKRDDTDHRGALPFDELPGVERTIMKVQSLANWRVLGSLADSDYQLLRDFSVKAARE